MAGIFFGISAGLCGFGAYTCFNNFSREVEKSQNLKNKLEHSIVNFTDKAYLEKQIGIVHLPICSPKYFYSINKLIYEKDISLRTYENYDLYTGKVTRVLVPVEVENILKKSVDKFLSDPTFGEHCKPTFDVSYLFSTTPSKIHCDGKYLTDLLQERHGIRIIYGGNMDTFELSIVTINSELFLFGENVGDNFMYSIVSDNKHNLINKVVSDNDESASYFVGGIFCTGGFIFCLISALAEAGKK
jgi:hypothetical protein